MVSARRAGLKAKVASFHGALGIHPSLLLFDFRTPQCDPIAVSTRNNSKTRGHTTSRLLESSVDFFGGKPVQC